MTFTSTVITMVIRHSPVMIKQAIPAIVLATTLAGSLAAQARMFTTGTPEELERARSIARAHLADTASAIGIDPSDLTISSVQIDQLSMAHVRVRQSFRGIAVLGAEAIVHLQSTGALSGETNNLLSGVKVDTRPWLSTSEAVAKAIDGSGCSRCLVGEQSPDLMIVRREGTDHLTYGVQLRGLDDNARPTFPVVYVDAHDGQIVQRYDNLQTSKPPLGK